MRKRLFLMSCILFISGTLFAQHSETSEERSEAVGSMGEISTGENRISESLDEKESLNLTRSAAGPENSGFSLSAGNLTMARQVGSSVDYYTGTANVNVQLYNISSYGIEIPVAVRYSASGIKLDDLPTWVGSNWNLTGGGKITRNVMGEPDETGFFNGDGYMASNSNAADWKQSAMKTKLENGFDGMPDVYSFELPTGQSGMFVINFDKSISLIPYQDLKIEWMNTSASYVNRYFVITDAQGFKFYFGSSSAYREQTTNNDYKKTKTYNSAWMLEKVSYGTTGSTLIASYSYKNGTPVTSRYFNDLYRFEFRPSTNASKYLDVRAQNVTTTVVPKVLTSIVWDTGKLEFISDVLNDYPRLKYIDVYGADNDYLKAIHVDVSSISYSSGKTKLDRIYEKVGSQERNICAFQYHNGSNIPGPSTIMIDNWGYYSGEGGVYAWPKHTILSYHVTGNSKMPNLTYARMGALQKITYPTGGWTEFEYEHHVGHKYGNVAAAAETVGGLRIKSITHRENANTVSSTTQYVYNANSYNNGGEIMSYYQPAPRIRKDAPGSNRVVTYGITKKPDFQMTDFTGASVVYNFVKEMFANGSYNTYEFAAFTTLMDIQGQSASATSNGINSYQVNTDYKVPYTTKFFGRGWLKNLKQYSSSNQLVYSETYTYATNLSPKSSVYSYPLHTRMEEGTPEYYKGRYQWISQPVVLTGKTVASGLYNQASTTTYTYQSSYDDLLPRTVIETDARGNSFKTTVAYPQDYTYTSSSVPSVMTEAQGIVELKNANIKSSPIETISYRKNFDESAYNVTGATIDIYKWNGRIGRPMLEQTKSLNINTLSTSITQSYLSGSSLIRDSRYDNYNPVVMDYNIRFNPTFVTFAGSNGNGTQIIYDGKDHSPIAYVSNVVYDAYHGYNGRTSHYTSFEETGSGVTLTDKAFSGRHVLNKNQPYSLSIPSGDYIVSYWRCPTLGGVWEEVRKTVNGGSYTVLEKSYYVDEFRMMPAAASMVTQVGRYGVGVISTVDEKGRATHFNYNGFGMPESVVRHDRQVVEKYSYTY